MSGALIWLAERQGLPAVIPCEGGFNQIIEPLAIAHFHVLFSRSGQWGIGIAQNKTCRLSPARWFGWRRDRDSNPGSTCADNGFRDRPDRPLWHLSMVKKRKNYLLGSELYLRVSSRPRLSAIFNLAIDQLYVWLSASLKTPPYPSLPIAIGREELKMRQKKERF